MEIIEQNITTILRPTGINLAPYVINPYQGCQMGCCFCYARFSKVAKKESMPWGSYVKVKLNAAEILEKELKEIRPERVPLGSTTECFQPVEKKYSLTRAIIRILNQRRIKYVIMSRSMLLAEYIDDLDRQLCSGVYFTVDIMPELIKQKFEPYAVSAEDSIGLVNRLNAAGINVIAYFCPVMPFLYEQIQKVCRLKTGTSVEFEILNFQMSGINRIIATIEQEYPDIAKRYKKMCEDKAFYKNVVEDVEINIRKISGGRFKDMKVHRHKYADYFKNIYPACF